MRDSEPCSSATAVTPCTTVDHRRGRRPFILGKPWIGSIRDEVWPFVFHMKAGYDHMVHMRAQGCKKVLHIGGRRMA